MYKELVMSVVSSNTSQQLVDAAIQKRAEGFLHNFQEQGILVLAGRKKEVYDDSRVLEKFFSLLKEAGESYLDIDKVLVDLHENGRRQRNIKLVARKDQLLLTVAEGAENLAFSEAARTGNLTITTVPIINFYEVGDERKAKQMAFAYAIKTPA